VKTYDKDLTPERCLKTLAFRGFLICFLRGKGKEGVAGW
jgi:hypothetical protein